MSKQCSNQIGVFATIHHLWWEGLLSSFPHCHVHQRVVFLSLKIARLDRPAAYYVDPILKRTQLGSKFDLQLTCPNCGGKDDKASYESWSHIQRKHDPSKNVRPQEAIISHPKFGNCAVFMLDTIAPHIMFLKPHVVDNTRCTSKSHSEFVHLTNEYVVGSGLVCVF